LQDFKVYNAGKYFLSEGNNRLQNVRLKNIFNRHACLL